MFPYLIFHSRAREVKEFQTMRYLINISNVIFSKTKFRVKFEIFNWHSTILVRLKFRMINQP